MKLHETKPIWNHLDISVYPMSPDKTRFFVGFFFVFFFFSNEKF